MEPRNSDLLKQLKVRFWYEGVRIRAKTATRYELEQLIESARTPKSTTIYKNKWSSYEKGKHIPNSTLVDFVDHKYPGTALEMNHPIWCSLALKTPVEFKRLEALFTVLEPKVKKFIYHPITESLPVQKRRKASFQLLWRLLKIGNMDALTALILYWHEASNDSDSSLPTLSKREIAKFIYKLLVSFGSVMYLRGLDRLMFKVVSEYIFKPTDWQNQYVGIDDESYQIIWQYFEYCLEILPNNMTRQKKVMRLFDYRYGDTYPTAYNMVLMPQFEFGPPSRKEYNQWAGQWKKWCWAWMLIRIETADDAMRLKPV